MHQNTNLDYLQHEQGHGFSAENTAGGIISHMQ